MTYHLDNALKQDNLDWCLDLIAEGYCNEASQSPVSWEESGDNGLQKKARKRGLLAQICNIDLKELSSARLPVLVCLKGGGSMVMVAYAKHGAMFVTGPAMPAEHIAWDALTQKFDGRIIKLSPITPTHLTQKNKVSFAKLTGDLGNLSHSTTYIVLLAVGIELCLIVAPLFMKLVLDRVLPAADTLLLITSGIFFLTLVSLQILLLDARSQALIEFSQRVNLRWLSNLFTHLMRLPMGFFEQRTVGDVASKFWSVALVQRTLTVGFIEGALDGLMALITILVLILIDAWLTVLPLIAVLFYVVVRWRCLVRQQKAEHERSRYSVVQQSHIWETISGIQSIKLFQRENVRLEAWLGHIARMFDGDQQYQQVEARIRTALTALMSTERVIVIALGTWMAIHQTLTIAQLVVFLTYNELFLNRSTTLADKFSEIALLDGHRDKIADIVLHESELPVGNATAFNVSDETACIEFHNVYFKHSSSEFPLLENFSLTVHPGECIAFTGPSGCGKTTVLRLMLGLVSPQKGQILIAGRDLKDIPPADYRSQLATVMQEDRLFTGSVLENITFFEKYYDIGYVIEVARIVDIYDDIMKLPDGLHTLIKDTGSILSSGQRQRLLLARALYKRPKFLFLDEATSHLDSARERSFTEQLSLLKTTRIVVSHHPRPLAAANRVFHHSGRGFVEILPQSHPFSNSLKSSDFIEHDHEFSIGQRP